MRGLRYCIVTAAVVCIAATAWADCDLWTFDTDLEGWTQMVEGSSLAWSATGNPGGSIAIDPVWSYGADRSTIEMPAHCLDLNHDYSGEISIDLWAATDPLYVNMGLGWGGAYGFYWWSSYESPPEHRVDLGNGWTRYYLIYDEMGPPDPPHVMIHYSSDVGMTYWDNIGLFSPPVCLGDSNCDETINWRDIDYLVAAMNDNVSAWEDMFLPGSPTCSFDNNDVNSDGTVNWRDIDPFVALMNTTCP
ncbi:MAG: hypothetical protein KAY37_08070 [Phycisphaerae bacterium]|nr:hypothetical protein [Phycisphaerae bacterium]